jgi:hypothetical protein
MLLLLLFILVVILVIIYLCFFNIKEFYTNTPLLVFKTNLNPYVANITYSPLNYSHILREKTSVIRNIVHNMQSHVSSPLYVTDVLSYSLQRKKKEKMLTIFDDEKMFFIVKPKDAANNHSLSDIAFQYTFGYFDNEVTILKIILRSLGLRSEKINIKTKKISFDETKTINDKWFASNKIDALLCFINLSNTLFLQKFDKFFIMDIVSYDTIQIDLIKFYAPFVKTRNIDVSPFFNVFKETNKVQFVIVFDMLIYGDISVETNNRLHSVLFDLIVTLGTIDVLNYYSMYFPLFAHTQKYMKMTNDLIITRDSRPILEQFVQDKIDIEAIDNINGFYDNESKELFINGNKIDTFVLTKDMKVKLQHQERDEENGDYIVIYVNELKTTLKKIVGKPVVENPYKDHRYECYGQKDIKSAGLCESKYDYTGINTKPVYQWDRRCEQNDECPFYQANKNYRNYFGGCIDGFCQMPLGTKQISYRRVDDEMKPMCHNCKDPLNPFCCEEQKDPKIYPKLRSPDYAFPLDSYERWKQIDAQIK